MTYNKCETCEAKDGKCGMLINGDCLNCYHTRKENKIVVHSELVRTNEELEKTFNIIKMKEVINIIDVHLKEITVSSLIEFRDNSFSKWASANGVKLGVNASSKFVVVDSDGSSEFDNPADAIKAYSEKVKNK